MIFSNRLTHEVVRYGVCFNSVTTSGCKTAISNLMKAHDSPESSKRTRRDGVFAIPDPVWPQQSVITEIVASIAATRPAPAQPEVRAATPSDAKTDYFNMLVAVATNVWRARNELRNAQMGQFSEEMKQFECHVDAIYQSLAEFGIEVHDHTGNEYDERQPLVVVNTIPTPGLDTMRVYETLLPSVYWNNRLLQNGEVNVATPIPSNTPVPGVQP